MAIEKVSITYTDGTEATFVGPLELSQLPTVSPVAKAEEVVAPEIAEPVAEAPVEASPETEAPAEVPAE